MDIARPDLKKHKQTRHRIVVIAAAIALAGTATAAISLGSSTPSVRRADLLFDTVKRGDFERRVRGPGKLVPSQTRLVVARTDARVERVLARPGTRVSADDPIIELSNPEVQDRLLAAEAAFAAAAGDHDALRARLESELLERQSELVAIRGEHAAAAVEEEASRRALESGVLAKVHYRKSRIALEQAAERVRIAERRVGQSLTSMSSQMRASSARLEQLSGARALRRLEAEALRITAGLDGVVQRIDVEEGQRVASGSNLGRIAREGTLIAELRIPESQAADLAAGQPSTVEIARSPVPGRVRRINPAVERGAILVEIEFDQPLPEGTRAEQSVDGTVLVERVPDTLYTRRPVAAAPRSKSSVFKLEDSDTAKRVTVRFGKDSATHIQIIDGLREGDEIVLSDMGDFDRANELSVE